MQGPDAEMIFVVPQRRQNATEIEHEFLTFESFHALKLVFFFFYILCCQMSIAYVSIIYSQNFT